jgi:hypothetical protein
LNHPSDDALLIRVKPISKSKTVEITKSFSFKLNLGNYQSADFFVSQKAQCDDDEKDVVGADLYDWCYEQVMAEVRDLQNKQAKKQRASEAQTRGAA